MIKITLDFSENLERRRIRSNTRIDDKKEEIPKIK